VKCVPVGTANLLLLPDLKIFTNGLPYQFSRIGQGCRKVFQVPGAT